MSRTAVARNSDDASFLGLLEQLTRDLGRKNSGSESVHGQALSSDSSLVTDAAFPSAGAQGKRKLVPATELRAGRSSKVPDYTQMSYEKALALHSRRKTALAHGTPKTASPPILASSEPPAADTGHSEFNRAPRPQAIEAESLAKSALKTTRSDSLKPADTAPAAKLGGSSKRAASRQHAPHERPSRTPASPKLPDCSIDASQAVSRTSTSHKPATASGTKSRYRAPRTFPQSAIIGSPPVHEANGQSENLSTDLEVRGATLQRTSNLSLDQNDQQGQRRAILSVRLTESEIAKLKARAHESGISVSAYMRSCVLDADLLRSQVKQALAEMRALSAQPPPGQAVLASGSRNSGGVAWVQLFLRSAAILLRPLFPFRRTA